MKLLSYNLVVRQKATILREKSKEVRKHDGILERKKCHQHNLVYGSLVDLFLKIRTLKTLNEKRERKICEQANVKPFCREERC